MKRALLIALLLGLAPLVASAATLTYSFQYITTYSVSGTVYTNIGNKSAQLSSGIGYDPTWVNRFSVMISVSGLQPGEDLNLVGLGISNTAGATVVTRPGLTAPWVPNNPAGYSYWDPAANQGDGGTVTPTVFTENTDAGPSSTDLRGIVVIASAKEAMLNQLGEAAPYMVGTVYVTWTGTGPSTLTVFADPSASPWNIWRNNTTGTGTTYAEPAAGISTVSGTYSFGVPEPGTMALLAMGGIGMLLRRRRR